VNVVFQLIFRLLEIAFVIGLVGCLFVIPQTAFMMFRVLVGHDDASQEEEPGPVSSLQNKAVPAKPVK
jgi:hypothetical protein